jgi:hypothetical protein
VSGEATALQTKRPWQTPRLVVHAVKRSANANLPGNDNLLSGHDFS